MRSPLAFRIMLAFAIGALLGDAIGHSSAQRERETALESERCAALEDEVASLLRLHRDVTNGP